MKSRPEQARLAASILGRLGRAKNTEAQKEAARQNGKMGGRPRGAGPKNKEGKV